VPGGPPMRGPDELRARVEQGLAELVLTPELGELAEPMRYALSGGKRIRPTLCLATTEAAGGDADAAIPAALALELIQAFSLVHDDLPAMDDDAERRGRPSAHVTYGDGVALLAGDALLTEAFRLALTYPAPGVAAELAAATQGMIAGQYLDITQADVDITTLHELKTGRLFEAAVGLGLHVAGVPESAREPWRAFGRNVGLLFQVVDDALDGDGYVAAIGPDRTRSLATEIAARARDALEELAADTRVLREIVDELAVRTV
jgi:geranylgeranyl diphosphate synthase, type II